MKSQNQYFLENEEIGLRRIELDDDLSNYLNWFNDQTVNEFNTHGVFPMDLQSLKNYITSLDQRILHLSVFVKAESKHIGNLSLQSIDLINRNAEFAIIMGEKDYWNKGYAYQASKLIIDHGFNKLNLYRVYCGTSELNLGMQKLALKLGMAEEGRRKGALAYNGRYVDLIEYGIVSNYKI